MSSGSSSGKVLLCDVLLLCFVCDGGESLLVHSSCAMLGKVLLRGVV